MPSYDEVEGSEENAIEYLVDLKARLQLSVGAVNEKVVTLTRMHYTKITYKPIDLEKKKVSVPKRKAKKQ